MGEEIKKCVCSESKIIHTLTHWDLHHAGLIQNKNLAQSIFFEYIYVDSIGIISKIKHISLHYLIIFVCVH